MRRTARSEVGQHPSSSNIPSSTLCASFLHIKMAYRKLSRTMRCVTSDVCGSSADTHRPSGPSIGGWDKQESSENGAMSEQQKKGTPSLNREGDVIASIVAALAIFSSATRDVFFLMFRKFLLKAASILHMFSWGE
ncbi:UNVERIFIED_CONTAM: hypothetical protein Sindi_2888500 [Sesamum indicum]